jgi:hypothetical protein
MIRWPLIGASSSHTLDSSRRQAQQGAAALFGRPWHEVAALLRERIEELDDETDD